MTHPKEHTDNPVYWAWYLAGIAKHALQLLAFHKPVEAAKALADALADFHASPCGKQDKAA